MKKDRIKSAVLLIAIAVVICALLAMVFAWISSKDSPFDESFQFLFPLLFTWFGGFSIISAFLLIATNLSDDNALHYGMGFYYGSALCAYVLTDYFQMENEELALLVSAIIVGLICYNWWLKNKS